MCQDFFDFDEQQENLERVEVRIAPTVIKFCAEHETFHGDELRAAVVAATGIAAPGSGDRILRQLRQQGIIDYVVVNRHQSAYRVLWVAGNKEA
jgi:hypothetical protein